MNHIVEKGWKQMSENEFTDVEKELIKVISNFFLWYSTEEDIDIAEEYMSNEDIDYNEWFKLKEETDGRI